MQQASLCIIHTVDAPHTHTHRMDCVGSSPRVLEGISSRVATPDSISLLKPICGDCDHVMEKQEIIHQLQQ